ncbi:hypothetical protein Y032_0586g333 [Ancylostoma ceylanicum]|uniref:G-protein coupled receptors family 1 profile domain-containing protein n=1 Tax=Ancylostoma ceylanicum TaxID=53326 RepID=A0A016WMX5_9BILA|nr:hypothetical protein Y032_0586g333 [Ancylostoma ceylanicum]
MFWKVALFSSNPTERGLMRAREAPAENATQPPLPIQHFVGADRTYAVVWYGVICSVSLALHVTFVIGTRRLCGWNSNFCFTLLFILSLACIIRFTTELIASLTALFYLDWIEYQALWIAFGSLAFAPYFTVVLLNFLITFHRLAYTAFPFKAAEYLNKSVLKVLCMVICEVVVFLYWEFIAVQGYGAWDLVIAETSNILFFDVLVVPYLILNGLAICSFF